jgi:predicted O-linked N-acetylglucosamine transferase (SPINDLY family)
MTRPELLNAARQLHRAGRVGEAESLYRRYIELEPRSAEVLHLLGLSLAAQNRFAEAIAELRRAVAIRPDYAEALYNLAKALQDDGQLPFAAESYRLVVTLRPSFAPAYNNLGIVLQSTHDLASAEVAFRDAIRIQPDYAEAHYNLGNVLKELNRLDEAIVSYRQALALKPHYPEALVNLGNVTQRKGDIDEAAGLFRHALEINPGLAVAHNSLGNALKDAGDLNGAIESYRRAIAAGGGPWAWDNLLYTIHFNPDYDARRIAHEHSVWGAKLDIARPAHPNDRSPDRRLNIAYVSPDFREHPVGRFMLPLLSRHDHDRCRIVCYSDVHSPDALTESLESHADGWRETRWLSDTQMAHQIREDQIDILVDLTMHMEGNRLPTFAQRPAPVQVAYLAYCSTTGLPTMDYRLSDRHLDPPGGDESVYSEKTIRLARTYWCYHPPATAPDVGPSPAARGSGITFGCLNNYSKVTDKTWDMWLGILREVGSSRLIVQCPEGAHRQAPLARMTSAGLDPDRITFVARVPMAEYFALYNQIDIALDPFPYGGGTTTCDALWMGVPVVTRTGGTAVSRGGSSILNNLGFSEWVATDAKGYVEIARALASDVAALRALRAQMRKRMGDSPLIDADGFARDAETAFRQMWLNWCQA